MPGITKYRRICHIPQSKLFRPEHGTRQSVVLALEELEAVRLADLEAMDQDTAASRMGVSRATFQRVLRAARRRIADALVNGKTIEIRGGKYTVADNHCACGSSCRNCRFAERAQRPTSTNKERNEST